MITEPSRNETIWHKGWEINWNADAAYWTGEGWDAYRGGCDLDAPRIMARTWDDMIAEIDDNSD